MRIQGGVGATKEEGNRKVVNNLYVKNFDVNWTEVELRKVFEPYGNIGSIFMAMHARGPYAFVSYELPEK